MQQNLDKFLIKNSTPHTHQLTKLRKRNKQTNMRKKKRRRGGAQTIAGLAGLRGHKKLRTCPRRWLGFENVPNGPRKNIWHPQNLRPISNQLTIKVSLEKFFSLKYFYNMSRTPTHRRSLITMKTTTSLDHQHQGPHQGRHLKQPTRGRRHDQHRGPHDL